MNLETLRSFFLWCTIINSGLLLVWLLMFLSAGGFIFRMHSRFFHLERAHFDAMSYAGMGLYKMGIFLFNLVPYVALLIVK